MKKNLIRLWKELKRKRELEEYENEKHYMHHTVHGGFGKRFYCIHGKRIWNEYLAMVGTVCRTIYCAPTWNVKGGGF